MMIDIDDFKSFNDRHGHPRGDDALRAVSAVIRVNLRDSDIAARYGGEEFVILLPETDASGARLVADRIREGIEAQKVVVESQALASCTVSIGLASFPAHVPTAAALVESADKALYRAKHRGKNRVEVAS
jgi:diguanylate cyclase (GGDEF)-like protein